MSRDPHKHHASLSAEDWVRRVNRSWIVRNHLNEHAEEWLAYLAALGDGRFQKACANARAMCGLRKPSEDPKPWFYSGLFSLATAEEARRFLEKHRITKAALPSMAEEAEVKLWLDRISPETKELMNRLRDGISRLHENR